MRIKNENDMFIYFEVIKELEPKNILDAGMFLKRIGNVSRQVMNQKIPKEICLDGIDFFPEVCFPVWKNVYDRIITPQDFMTGCGSEKYCLGIVLGSDGLEKDSDLENVFKKMGSCCEYLFYDCQMVSFMKDVRDKMVRDIRIGQDIYYFMDNHI